MVQIKDIVADFGGCDFLLPYFQRALGVGEDDEPQPTAAGVRIVTDEAEGSDHAKIDEYCRERRLPVVVIRCPYIVGTGMTGLTRKIAAGIYKGTFVHIAGNDARISVVHATDVARAASIAAGTQGTYTLTDGTDSTIHDLAEAFAHRMGDKRIFTIGPRWARIWYGKRYFDTLTSSHTADDTFCAVFPDFHPASVVEYLKTHVYDEQSL